MVPGNGVQHLAQRQLNALAGNADLQFRLLTTQRPPQLSGKMHEFFLLIGFEQVIEGVHRKGIPYIFRRGGHEYDQHLRVGLPQSAGGLDAVGARHADIQKHHGV